MTSVGKTTARMMLGSLATLVALGIADPTSVRLMPSLTEHFAGLLGVAAPGRTMSVPSSEEVSSVIADYNRALSMAYRELDPAVLAGTLMGDGLRRNYTADIDFLRRRGQTLELSFQDIRVRRVIRLDESRQSVDTVESVGARYLKTADRSEIAAYPTTAHAMNYTLEKTAAGWKIIGVETRVQGRRNE